MVFKKIYYFGHLSGVALLILSLDTLDGGEWFSFMPQPLYYLGKTPSAHWVGGWVGPRASVGSFEKRKIT